MWQAGQKVQNYSGPHSVEEVTFYGEKYKNHLPTPEHWFNLIKYISCLSNQTAIPMTGGV